jgi:hypothetical protein
LIRLPRLLPGTWKSLWNSHSFNSCKVIYIYEHIYALLVARNYILDHLLHLPSISTLKRIALNRRQRKIFTDIVIITDHTCLRQSSSAKYYYRKRHEAIRFTKTTLDHLFFYLRVLRLIVCCFITKSSNRKSNISHPE